VVNCDGVELDAHRSHCSAKGFGRFCGDGEIDRSAADVIGDLAGEYILHFDHDVWVPGPEPGNHRRQKRHGE
jgi:hypothetical protein